MAALLVQIEARIPWRCYRAAGGNWIAVCDPLGLTVQSARYSELAEDVADTLDLMFRDLLRGNELDRFLRGRGWSRTGGKLPKPSNARFDVPFELLMTRGRDGSSSSLHQ